MIVNAGNVVLLLIRETYDSLSNSEKQVADFVLEHADETIRLTLASLSRKVRVSEPTVIRFCRKLNFGGYQDFKIALARGSAYTEETLKIIHEEVKPLDSLEEISEKVINSHTIAMQQTFSMMNYQKLGQFLQLVQNAEHLDFFGLGGSGTVAVDVENKFIRTGINTRCCIDAHIQLMWTALRRERDVIVIFSNSGATKHFAEVMRLARKNNTKLVLITSGKNTVLTRLADITLQIHAKETSYKKEPSSARIAMLAIMDVIVTAIALEKQDTYIHNIYQTREALEAEKY